MHENIVFLGGIHGSGKGIIASKISDKLGLIHLSASDVLKWSELNTDQTNKLVSDISDTQNRLISGLRGKVDMNSSYILDGHFCLFDSQGKINKVDVKTFELISPRLIAIKTCNVEEVSDRLSNRDHRKYEEAVLKEMQDKEVEHGLEVAKLIGVKAVIVQDDIEELIEEIEKLNL